MSIMNKLKKIFIKPFTVKIATVKIGSIDTWNIVDTQMSKNSLVICGGVGHSITFEEDLVKNYGCNVILLDPSPTGKYTMSRHDHMGGAIEYKELGLAASSGTLFFGEPAVKEEGSFRKGSVDDSIQFPCVSLEEICGGRTIDLLKIDIEGFEYEVLNSVLKSKNPKINQICVEIHTNKVISIPQTILSAMRLIVNLYFHGYKIVYNHNMDFTFVHNKLLQ